MKKWAWVVVALVALEGMYVAGAQAFLRSGTFLGLVNPEGEDVRVTFGAARSYFPGQVLVRDLVVSGGDTGAAWRVTARELRGWLRLDALLDQRVRIASARAEGVDLSLRLAKEKAETGKSDAEKSTPKAGSGDPAQPVATPRTAESPRAAPADDATGNWAFDLTHLSLRDVGAITINERSIRGKLAVDATVRISRAGALAVEDGTIELREARVEGDGTEPLARVRSARAKVALASVDVDAPATVVVAAFALEFKSEIEIMPNAVARPLIAAVPWIEIEDEGGTLQLDLKVVNGRVVAPSQLEARYPKIAATMFGQSVRGSGSLRLATMPEGEALEIVLAFGAYDIVPRGRKTAEIKGQGLTIRAEGPAPEAGKELLPQLWVASLAMPEAEAQDLSFVTQLLPSGTGFKMEGGKGAVEARLEGIGLGRAGQGEVKLRGKGVAVSYDETKFIGDLSATVRLSRISLDERALAVDGSELGLKNVATSGAVPEKDRGWWGDVKVPKGRLRVGEKTALTAAVELKGRDLRPLLALFEVGDGLPDAVRRTIELHGLAAKAHVEADEDRMIVRDAEMSAEGVDAKAWFSRKEKSRDARAIVTVKGFDVGLALTGKTSEVKIIGVKNWYESVAAPKP